MRFFYTLFLLVGWFCPNCFGQNFSIVFQQDGWENVLKRAVNERKQVFLDCYTAWCGPCKILEKTVFIQDSVAMFFNRNFVCVKIDMEKEGKELARKFQIQAFPTLLFIDPETEEVNHRLVGAGDAAWLIEGGKKALEGLNSLGVLTKRFAKGERKPEFMRDYLNALADAGMRVQRDRVMECWFRGLNDEELLTPLCWSCIERHIDAQTVPSNYCFMRFLGLYKEYYRIAEKRMVDLRISVVIQNRIAKYTRWKAEQGNLFDEEGRQQLMEDLQKMDYEKVSSWQAQLSTAEYVGKQDFKGLLLHMKKILKEGVLKEGEEGYYLALFLPYLAASKERSVIEEALEWMEEWSVKYPADPMIESLKKQLITAL